MPLVLLVGHPCCGKSTVARALFDVLSAAGLVVEIVSENSLSQDRNVSYLDVPAEKNTRGKLRSEVSRHCSRATTVVFDSLNSIKGYRYELWCIARTSGTRYCVVWVDTTPDTCRAWNAARPPAEAYATDILEDLLRRFEPPNAQNRWDAPLHRVDPLSAQDLATQLQSVAVGLTTDAGDRPTIGPNAVISRDLQPGLATAPASLSRPNFLYELDNAAQMVIEKLSEAQAAAGSSPAGRVEIMPGMELCLQEPVTLADLRRLKRGFIKVATSGMDYKLQAGDPATRVFVGYLRDNLKGVLR